jgi:steroid 5-alpha reductase family enzyme
MDIFPSVLLLLGATLLITTLGFRYFVYFISVGYAFSVAAMALICAWLFRGQLNWLSGLHLALMIAWGLRLGAFVVLRDRQKTFQASKRANDAENGGAKLTLKISIWITVSLLYVLMVMPGLLHAAGNGQPQPALELSGLLVMVIGLALEGVADWQKSQFKQHFPQAFTNTGLYRWVRCPNYLGEILFWLGNVIAGLAFITTWLEWAAVLIGLVSIILIMLGSTRRLEIAQDARYGNQPAYQAYVRSVPVLIPWVPVYSLKKNKIYLG